MLFPAFFQCLADARPTPRVEIDQIARIINERHHGVGRVTFKWFKHFEGAQLGGFVWMDEEIDGRNEEPYRDATVFLSSALRDDRRARRVVAAKELMHVFDTGEQKTGSEEAFRQLLNDMENQPLPEDASPQYKADREALWKAILTLIPPWLRQEYLDASKRNEIGDEELAARWWVPETIVAAAMGSYYEVMAARFEIPLDFPPPPAGPLFGDQAAG